MQIIALLLALTAVTCELGMEHGSCDEKHEKLFGESLPVEIQEEQATHNNRVLSQNSFRKFRILIDWTAAEQFYKGNEGLETKLAATKQIIGSSVDYFQDRFQVNSPETRNYNFFKGCHGVNTDASLVQKTLNQDLVIVIKPHNEQSGWYAAAGACHVDATGRPITGAVFVNFRHISLTPNAMRFIPGVFIHEILHILGVNGHFLRNITRSIQIGDHMQNAIIAPKVVEYAKEYFKCNSIEGVPLENGGGNGSKGSHWEKTVFGSEVMNPGVATPMPISRFTVLTLEALGWYKGVNAAQLYVYLKGDGCGTIRNLECKGTSPEFCTAAERSTSHCNSSLMSKGNCSNWGTFLGSCGYVAPSQSALCSSPNSDFKSFSVESYGAHSRCFTATEGRKTAAACLRSRCKDGKVQIQFGTDVHTCEKSGKANVSFDSFKGQVICPDYNEFCKELMPRRCPLDCSGNGICMNGNTCQCNRGFTGAACNCKNGECKNTENDKFVTDFDIRNKKDDEDNGDDNDDDENEEKPDEEEDEDEKEDPEEEKSEEQIRIEGYIAKLYPNYYRSLYYKELHSYYISYYTKLNEARSCSYYSSRIDRHKKSLERSIKRADYWKERIDAQVEKVKPYLTSQNLKDQFNHFIATLVDEQSKILNEKMRKLLERNLERVVKYLPRYQALKKRYEDYAEKMNKIIKSKMDLKEMHEELINKFTDETEKTGNAALEARFDGDIESEKEIEKSDKLGQDLFN